MVKSIFRTYVPKPTTDKARRPLPTSIPKQPSLPDKSHQINSFDTPFGISPVSVEAAGTNHRSQTVVGDNETRVQDIKVLGGDLAKTEAVSKAEKNGADDDIGNRLLSTTRLLSAECKHAPIEENPSMTSVVNKGTDQVLEGSRIDPRGQRTPGISDPIELRSDYAPINTEYNCHIVKDLQPESDAVMMDHSHTLFGPTISKHDDSDNRIDKTKTSQASELQMPFTLSGGSIRNCNRTPLLPRLDDRKHEKENTDHSDPDDSGDDYRTFKRQKILSDGTNSSSENTSEKTKRASQHVGTTRASAGSTPAPTKRELCPEMIDPGQDWEVRAIIGKEDVAGVLHYMVDWHPTLLPKQLLEDSKDLIEEFEARIRAQRRRKQERGRTILKSGEVPIERGDVLGLPEPKKPRGRPRKRL